VDIVTSYESLVFISAVSLGTWFGSTIGTGTGRRCRRRVLGDFSTT
jgi:hypothetical protein